MAKSKFYNEIVNATIERQVEDVYNKGLGIYFKNSPISYPFACDGYMECKTDNEKDLRLLIEYKFDKNFDSAFDRAKVILQSIYYVKQFELTGRELPNVILIADKNECFLIHTNNIIKYLDYDIDWKIAPSTASDKYIDLCIEISNDEDVRNSFVYSVNEEFSFKVVADKIKDFADNVKRYVHITEDNIVSIFDTFTKKVLGNASAVSANDLVGLFVGVISNDVNYYVHPNRKTILVTPYGEIKIKSDGYNAFISNFSRNYSPIEKRKFTEISDRLIEDTNRRNKGEFYTPKLFVDYAHKMIEQYLGADWKERFVVWDNCCGTKNLTKDYNFNELYCSTLEMAELEMSSKYNANAYSFQFDFLNDSLDNLPKSLFNALEQNKPIVFLINPPYATACNQGETSKEGINATMVRNAMVEQGLGGGAENLQHQFMYRIAEIKNKYNLTNVVFALFSKPIYLSGQKSKEFLTYFCNNFEYKNGIIFQASNFADVASNWGITFNIWQNGITNDVNNFIHDIVEVENNSIVVKGQKNIYNAWGNYLASTWVREEIKGVKCVDLPNLTNAISIKDSDKNRGKGLVDGFGYFHNNANSVQYNGTYVGLYSSPCAAANGLPITKDNVLKCISLFTARKLILGNWINDKDEYIAPNEGHESWTTFVADSVVYSLFNTSSNQSSLRQIEYKGSKWDIKNEFFFMSKEQMLELASENNNDDMYNDCSVSEERFVYRWLQEHREELSPMAKSVLDMAIELVEKSMKYRPIFNEDNEQYQINNWDCGWYQIKAMLKAYMPNELKAFNELYKAFAEQLRPMVYELGFLK